MGIKKLGLVLPNLFAKNLPIALQATDLPGSARLNRVSDKFFATPVGNSVNTDYH